MSSCFAAARNLRAIHVNFYREADETEERSMMNDALRIVRQCPATVTQIGCDTRVWNVSSFLVKTIHSLLIRAQGTTRGADERQG